MWISQQLSRSGERAAAGISTGKVTIAGDATAVMLQGERRELPIASPAGIAWAPAAGDDVIVLCSEEGERCVIGLAGGQRGKAAPGEIIMECGSVSMRLGKQGINITGKLNVQGQLILNGVDVGKTLEQLMT